MKKLFIFFFILFTSITVAYAQSSLEPCKTDKIKNETNCFGKFIFSNGDMYSGEVQNGMANGEGVYLWKQSNTKYDGTFINNRPNGKVKVTYDNGDLYVGEMKDGTMHGEGTFTKSDGTIQKGTWVDGEYKTTPFFKIKLNTEEKSMLIVIIVVFIISIIWIIILLLKFFKDLVNVTDKINSFTAALYGWATTQSFMFVTMIINKFFFKDESLIIFLIDIFFILIFGSIIVRAILKSNFSKIKNKKQLVFFKLFLTIVYISYLMGMIKVNYY